MTEPSFREARQSDLTALRDLERIAGLAALGHVFPPERYPFPDDAVLTRWRIVMDDPDVRIIVADDPDSGGLVAHAAYDSSTLRHVAVHPDWWGRGLATRAIDAACTAIARGGASEAGLWVLAENHRARRLYAHLGWVQAGESQEAAWPPHPTELRYRRRL